MFYDKNKNKDQNIKDSDDNMSQKEMSKNPIINKINRANNQNYNSNKNKHNNNNNDISSSHNSSGRNYDKRNMATDDIAFERFKKRFRR